MPIYEYECKTCNEVFEKIAKIGNKQTKCDKCGTTCKKIMSSFSFKVNGFNAANSYHKTEKQKFIEQGPHDYEINLKKNGTRTAHEQIKSMNGTK